MDSGKKKAITVMLTEICSKTGLRRAIIRIDDANPSLDRDFSGQDWDEVRNYIAAEFPPDRFELKYSDSTMKKLFSDD